MTVSLNQRFDAAVNTSKLHQTRKRKNQKPGCYHMKGKTKGASTIRKPGCRQHEMKNCWRHSRGNLFLANCNWEDSMFACNHLLGVWAKHIQTKGVTSRRHPFGFQLCAHPSVPHVWNRGCFHVPHLTGMLYDRRAVCGNTSFIR